MQNGKSNMPACQTACPAGVDVPRYIRYIREGKFTEALNVIRQKIPFPAVCGYACVHPCETKCARVQYDEPVAIRMLKRAAREYGQETVTNANEAGSTGKKVAIIGAGPCGLSAAYYLAKMGHEITIFEALPEPGGMLRYGIPEYRLPNDVIDHEISMITRQGVKIITNTTITLPKVLLKEGFDCVLVTVGAWKERKLGIEMEESANVINGLSFLKEINSGNKPTIGKKVVVVGGGNTAIDAARASVRMGAETTIIYRRTREQMPASREEIKDAIEEGIRIEFLTAPVKVSKNDIICTRMALGPKDSSNRPSPVPIAGTEFSISCDTVIVAIGQIVDVDMLHLEHNHDGNIKIDNDTFATSMQAVFAAGDAVTGPSSIIEAIAQAQLASNAIDQFLGGSGLSDNQYDDVENRELIDEAPRGTIRPAVHCKSVKERLGGFDLVEFGYTKETAILEANRCLACDMRDFKTTVNFDVCKGCGYCKEVCSLNVFEISDTFNAQGCKPVFVSGSERCIGCLKCLYVCPDFAIGIESEQ